MKTKKSFPLSADQLLSLRTLLELEGNLHCVLSQKWYQRKVSVDEKIDYIQTISGWKSRLWISIHKAHPATKKGAWSASSTTETVDLQK